MEADAALDPERPDCTAIHLPCRHQFTALCLVYHWLLSENVRCPLCRAGPANGRLLAARIPRHIRIPMKRQIFMTTPLPQKWFATHDILCTLEGVDSHYKHTIRLGCSPIESGFMLISRDISAIIMPVVMLQIVLRSAGHPDLHFRSSCWVSVDDDFDVRVAIACIAEGYYLIKKRGTLKAAFYVDLDHFKRMAWNLDHDIVASSVDTSPYVIRDL